MELKEIVAKNLVALRKKAGMTQLELAEKLNYSDKAVSKWERGESLPDLETIKKLADLYSVSVDALLNEQEDIISSVKQTSLSGGQKMLITLISVVLVWAVATVAYVLLCWFGVDKLYASYAFIVALPITFIVVIVFNSMWGNIWINFLSISALLWTVALCVYLPLAITYKWLCFIVPIPLQIALLFFYGLKTLNLKIKRKSKEN